MVAAVLIRPARSYCESNDGTTGTINSHGNELRGNGGGMLAYMTLVAQQQLGQQKAAALQSSYSTDSYIHSLASLHEFNIALMSFTFTANALLAQFFARWLVLTAV